MKRKHRLLSFTVGGGEDHYRKDGQNRYPVEEFLYSFEQLAALCQMK
ncbi:NAD(P)H-dependent oxidoreductase [uncultured Allisonella sp.]|nr:NAD(P)H-dependent oxidoreductase [uncultured Allisonella sp.]